MSLQSNLKKFGLNNKELDIYTTLLKHGALSPSDISKITKINRATVYSSAKGLQGKGLIIEDISKHKTLFVPTQASQLNQIIKREEKELEEKRNLIKEISDELSLITSNKTYPVPKIRFIDETNLEKFIFENMDKWIESLKKVDSTWWGTQDYTFSESFKDLNDWYWKKPEVKGIKMNLISNDTAIERSLKQKFKERERDVRFSQSMNFTSSVWVGGEYLIMIVTRNKPFYLFEIHDATLTHNMREVFKDSWKNTPQS